MCAVMPCLSIGAFRADAVFASWLQRGDEPSVGQVRRAVAAAIRAFGYSGCAERVAQEFGDHPETAVIRVALGAGGGPRGLRGFSVGAASRQMQRAGRPSPAAR